MKANILAAESNIAGEVFNVGGDGEGIELNDAITMIEKFAGKEAIRDFQKVVKGDVRHTSADCSKTKKY